jgi:hypothetical protein
VVVVVVFQVVLQRDVVQVALEALDLRSFQQLAASLVVVADLRQVVAEEAMVVAVQELEQLQCHRRWLAGQALAAGSVAVPLGGFGCRSSE